MNIRKSFAFLTAFLLNLIFMKCYTVTNLQSPKVMEQGERSVNIGIGAWLACWDAGSLKILNGKGGSYWEQTYGLRTSIGKNRDLGFRIYGPLKGFPLGLFGDIKWQLMQKPVLVAFDLGLSCNFFPFAVDNGSGGSAGVIPLVAAYPMLLVGFERLYAGPIARVGFTVDPLRDDGSLANYGMVLGSGFGSKKFRIRPELIFYSAGRSRTDIIGGLGLQLGR